MTGAANRHLKAALIHEEDSPPPSAEEVLAVIAGQIGSLETLTVTLEHAVAAAIQVAGTIPDDAIQNIQRLDFLRQGLRDAGALVDLVGPRVAWKDDAALSVNDLKRTVHMRGSLADLVPEIDSDADDDGILL